MVKKDCYYVKQDGGRYVGFDTLEDAKSSCMSDIRCTGIRDRNCYNSDKRFYKCTGKPWQSSQFCVHRKKSRSIY